MSWELPDIRRADVEASAGRWWQGVLVAGLLLALVGCQASPRVSARATIPSGKGVVVGGIDYCSGLPPAIAKNPGFVAGTVTVLRGTVSTRPESGGVTKILLPTERAASQTVAKHQEYRFVLPPGPYVLVGHYTGHSNIEPNVSVVVRLGKETKRNIPNECM